MREEKTLTSTLVRPRPYQGVRVKDPVKELLRRKRSLEPHSTKRAPPAVDVVAPNNLPLYTQGIFTSEVSGSSSVEVLPAVSDGGQQRAGWRAAGSSGGGGGGSGLQAAVSPWFSSDYSQQDPSAAPYSSSPALTADVYMQTLCPSYTMLTYTHTPLLTNFGTIPVAPASTSHPQMELQDSGLTYLPWAQPLATLSAVPGQGVQFVPRPAAVPGSPLVHMPVSMSLATMIPQGVDPQPQILELPTQPPIHEVDPESLDEDPDVDSEPPSLLDKLLEDQKNDLAQEDRDSYSSSLFGPDI